MREKINPNFNREVMLLEQRELNIYLVESLLLKIKALLEVLPKEERQFKKILIQDRKELKRQLAEMKKAYKRGESFIFTNVVALYHIEMGIQAIQNTLRSFT